MLVTALSHDGPIALRYPRGNATGVALDDSIRPIPIGTGEILENGGDVLILALGDPSRTPWRPIDCSPVRISRPPSSTAVLSNRWILI